MKKIEDETFHRHWAEWNAEKKNTNRTTAATNNELVITVIHEFWKSSA